ncbi:MAG: hypothetical protein ACI87E_004026 [Mariniblastus sp.]|jgi:hypothetical protein
MEIRDLFVAAVALTIGASFLIGAIFDRGWCFHLKIVKIIVDSQGRTSARSFVGFLGTVLVLIGLLILFPALSFLTPEDKPTNLRNLDRWHRSTDLQASAIS